MDVVYEFELKGYKPTTKDYIIIEIRRPDIPGYLDEAEIYKAHIGDLSGDIGLGIFYVAVKEVKMYDESESNSYTKVYISGDVRYH